MQGRIIAGDDVELVGHNGIHSVLSPANMLDARLDRHEVAYAPSIGFMAVSREESYFALGFYASPDRVLPDAFRAEGDRGNAGPRDTLHFRSPAEPPLQLFNTPEGAMGAPILASAIGIYLVGLESELILDVRRSHLRTSPNIFTRVSRFLLKGRGAERYLPKHPQYPRIDMILRSQTVAEAERRNQRGYTATSFIEPAVLEVQTPDIGLTLVGRVSTSFFMAE